MAKLAMPKSYFFTTKKGRQKKLKKRAKEAIEKKILDDPLFVQCFVNTSPTLAKVLRDDGKTVEEEELVKEAEVLHDALGDSKNALNLRNTAERESKYKSVFTFAQELHPPNDQVIKIDRGMVCEPIATEEGPLPTYFQFQRQDLTTILDYYARHTSLVHGPDHICRSLILAMAMAKFYLKNGQKKYLPGGKDAGVLQKPANDEVDIATICFGVGFHDSGRNQDGRDFYEHESGRNAFYYMRELGYSIEYTGNVAKIIVKNEEANAGRVLEHQVSRTSVDHEPDSNHRNSVRMDPAPAPPERPFSINDLIVHDADTLEIHRTLLTKRGPAADFDKRRLSFLEMQDYDSDGLQVDNRNAARDQLIQDAKDLAELTRITAGPAGRRDDERRNIIPRFAQYPKVHGKLEPLLKEFERYIIDTIFDDPSKYPFIYKYYFEECFDPTHEQLRKLSSEQRLALIRGHVHALERKRRDRTWAVHAVTKYNNDNTATNAQYNVDTLLQHLLQSRLTINLSYNVMNIIINSMADVEDPLYKQFWQVIWEPGARREGGGGADTNPNSRDPVERLKLNYQTYYTDPVFRSEGLYGERPNYAAINAALIPTGAVHKYGNGEITLYLHDHIRQRLTYSPGDTFTPGTLQDTVCSAAEPAALLRWIKGAQGFNPDLLKCIGARKGWENTRAKLTTNLNLSNVIYAEAHIHGPLSWKDDIETIVIEVTQTDGTLDTAIRDFARRCDIQVCFTAKGLDAVYSTREQARTANLANPPAQGKINLFAGPQPQQQQQQVVRAPQPQQQQQQVVRAPQPQPQAIDRQQDQQPQQHECPIFKPNRWKPNLCMKCQSTPGSAGCLKQRKIQ